MLQKRCQILNWRGCVRNSLIRKKLIMTNEEIKEQIEQKKAQVDLLNREIDELKKKFDGDKLEVVREKYLGAVIRRNNHMFSKVYNIQFLMDKGTNCYCDMLTIDITYNYNPNEFDDISHPILFDEHDDILLSTFERNTGTQADFDRVLKIYNDFVDCVSHASTEELNKMYPVED